MTPPGSGPALAPGLLRGADRLARCGWCGDDPGYVAYHDSEWGRPVADDRRLFEKLALEGFQSGLSWLTILRKRPAFRAAFADFDPARVARFTDRDVERLLADAAIVRHRGKIEATIHNAARVCALLDETTLAAYVWRFEPTARPRRLDLDTLKTHTTSPESTALARDLKRRGFRFVGPTTAYAFMQAMGLVNDHLTGCHLRAPIETLRASFARPT
jgi:DNA-3-methyladenine glycosylase I